MPQLSAMHEGDQSRKRKLVEHGFRLPSALDSRPLKASEFWSRVPRAVLVSATPGSEVEALGALGATQQGATTKGSAVAGGASGGGGEGPMVELLVRPTGIPDPAVQVVDASLLGGYEDHLLGAIEARVALGEKTIVTVG